MIYIPIGPVWVTTDFEGPGEGGNKVDISLFVDEDGRKSANNERKLKS